MIRSKNGRVGSACRDPAPSSSARDQDSDPESQIGRGNQGRTVRAIREWLKRSRGGARQCVCGLNGRCQVREVRELRGQGGRLRDHERVLVRGSARFVVMPVHDELDSLDLTLIRSIVVVMVAGDMSGNHDSHRPGESECCENQ